MAKLKSKTGVDLSPETIDALASEAEAGYDLSKATRVKRGRPSLSPSGESIRVQIRVDAELAEAIRNRAASEHRTVSEVGRDALRSYVARSRPKKPGSRTHSDPPPS